MAKQHISYHLIVTALLVLTLSACNGLQSPVDGKGAEPTATAEMQVMDTEEPEPTDLPEPTDTPGPSPTPLVLESFIYGQVYHDECINNAADHFKESDIDKCVLQPDGSLKANGQYDEGEQTLSNAVIQLYLGACPSSMLVGQTSTNSQGFYVFPNIPAGQYCIVLDPHASENADRQPPWLPGEAITPGDGIYDLTIAQGEIVSDINFGWDFANLPLASKACTDIASFVEPSTSSELRYMSSGLPFESSWQLHNDGSCTWNSNYTLDFLLGEAMTDQLSLNLAESVEPGDSVTITLPLTAPEEKGEFIGAWEFRNDLGNPVSVGVGGEKLTVHIETSPSILGTKLFGSPDWFDSFDVIEYWNPSEGGNGGFIIADGRMQMYTNREDGFDIWLLTSPQASNGFVEAVFSTGEYCNDYDRYGLVVRSPQTNQGYFVGVTCNGFYSIRKWDGGKWTSYTGYRASDEIRQGGSQSNVVGAYFEESLLAIYINGELIESISLGNNFWHGGRFGVFIAAEVTEGFTVYVDEIAMWGY
jgi:hypothetical protein